MSQELITIKAPMALTIPVEQADAMQEAFAINFANGSLSEFDIPRIRVMSGAALWLVPGLEGDQTVPRIEGVVVLARDTRIYYKSKDAGNVPPDCSSSDNVTGTGTPGGKCAECPLAKWESALDAAGQPASGQACKQMKQLFMIRGESQFPEIVSLPPTSVKNARQFFLKLTTQGIPYFHALVAIELEKAQNAQGKPYGKAVMKFLRRLTPEEGVRAVNLHRMCVDLPAKLPAGTDQSSEAGA